MKSSKVIPGKLLSALLLILTSFSCRSSPTGPHVTQNVQLSAADVGCTEVWLKIAFTDSRNGGQYEIKRNGKPALGGSFSGGDTVIADDGVQAIKGYTYVAYRIVNGSPVEQSQPLQVTTLDSTSHNWIWQTWTLGDGIGSILHDVAIINDTLIYAVGEIYLKDSTGEFDPTPYNLAVWNGTSWQIKRVTVQTRYGLVTAPFYSVYAFSGSDIWFSSGVPIRGDGENWTQYSLFDTGILNQNDGYLTKIWGRNSNDIYFVGAKGTVVHYDGSWQKIPSGTSTLIDDVWGTVDPSGGSETVYCAVSDFFQAGGHEILKITSANQVDSIPWIGNEVESVWTSNGYPLYACGDGLFKTSVRGWSQINLGISAHTNHVRGNSSNDVFVVGIFNLIAHYNGSTWQTFFEGPSGDYVSIAVNGNLAVAVGATYSRALVAIGRRR